VQTPTPAPTPTSRLLVASFLWLNQLEYAAVNRPPTWPTSPPPPRNLFGLPPLPYKAATTLPANHITALQRHRSKSRSRSYYSKQSDRSMFTSSPRASSLLWQPL
jgi:hypothetical protein